MEIKLLLVVIVLLSWTVKAQNDLHLRYVSPNGSDDGNCTKEMPCQTLHYAVFEDYESRRNYTQCAPPPEEVIDSTIMVEDGDYIMEGFGLVLCNVSNITIRAVNPGKAVIRCACFNCPIRDAMFGNVYLQRAKDITFEGIVFEKCGYNASNVFVRTTTNLTIRNCVFRDNVGSPLQLRFSTGLVVEDTMFIDNHNLLPAEPDTNSTNITELYRAIISGGGITYYSDSTVELTIRNCTFDNNSANVNDVNNSRPVLLKTNGHGGAIIVRLAGSSNSSIFITDTVFSNNHAQVDGGAIYFSFSEQATSNTVTLTNLNFVNNNVDEASGGAVSVNSFSISYLTRIFVSGCNFINNSANAGGAFSAVLYDSDENSATQQDSISFSDCRFINNSAFNEGTAVGLFSLVHVDQVGYPVNFTNCIFDDNYSSMEDDSQTDGDTSALAAFRFPVTFNGTNRFVRNVGGGITLLNTKMDAHGEMLFMGNSAVFGGGIAMDDRCLLNLYENTNISFLDNSASESGGAIYVDFPPIRFVIDIFNRLCFMQFVNERNSTDLPPQDWAGVSVSFIGNTARLSGAAIYASDLRRCSWLGNKYTNDTSLIFIPPDGLNTPFVFDNNNLMQEGRNSDPKDEQLATSPSRINITLNNLIKPRVQPGETVSISLLALDQLNNSREAVWSLEAPGEDANLGALSANVDNYNYEVPSATELCSGCMLQYSENISVNLTFSLLRTLGEINTVELYVMGCLPGYKRNNDSTDALCVCDTGGHSDIVRCDDSLRYLYLREGVWGEMNEETGELQSYQVLSAFVSCSQQGRLPGCLYQFDAPDVQCIDGRKGRLCGTCSDGHGVTLDLQSCRRNCVPGIVLFILLCIAVLVLSILILLVDFELPIELKGFIFYAQVIGLVYRPYITIQEPGNSIDPFYIIVNLLGFSVPIPYCLNHSLDANHVALLGYIPPFLALAVVVVYTLLARWLRPLGEHSALRGIGFMGLFIYKYIADTSFVMISCVDAGGFVFQYDGAKKCTDGDYMPFYVIGMLLVVFFVFPAPFAIGYICARRPRRFQHFADVLTVGLNTQHYWYGGWDLGRRLPFVFISFFLVLARPSLILFFMSLAALVVLGVHCFTKPYKEKHVNAIEAAVLLNLLLVTGAFLDPTGNQVPRGFSQFLVMLPFAYAACFLVYKICRRFKLFDKIRDRYFGGSDDSAAPQDNKGSIVKTLAGEEINRDTTLHDPASDSSNGSGVVATLETDIDRNHSANQSHEEAAPTPPRPRAATGDEDFSKAREELLFL